MFSQVFDNHLEVLDSRNKPVVIDRSPRPADFKPKFIHPENFDSQHQRVADKDARFQAEKMLKFLEDQKKAEEEEARRRAEL